MKNVLLTIFVFVLVIILLTGAHPNEDYGSSSEEPIVHSGSIDDRDIIETFEFYGNCDYVYLTVLKGDKKDKHTGKYAFMVIKGTSEEILKFKTFASAIREVERSLVNCEDLFPYNVILIDEEEDNQCYGVYTDYTMIGRFCPLSEDEHSKRTWYFQGVD